MFPPHHRAVSKHKVLFWITETSYTSIENASNSFWKLKLYPVHMSSNGLKDLGRNFRTLKMMHEVGGS